MSRFTAVLAVPMSRGGCAERAGSMLRSVDFDRLRHNGICRSDYDFIVQYPPSLLLPVVVDYRMLYHRS